MKTNYNFSNKFPVLREIFRHLMPVLTRFAPSVRAPVRFNYARSHAHCHSINVHCHGGRSETLESRASGSDFAGDFISDVSRACHNCTDKTATSRVWHCTALLVARSPAARVPECLAAAGKRYGSGWSPQSVPSNVKFFKNLPILHNPFVRPKSSFVSENKTRYFQ